MTHPDVGASTAQLAELARVVIGLGHQITAAHGSVVVAGAQAAVAHIEGARWVSITVVTQGRVRTLAASAPVAPHADALPGEAGTGPAVEPAPDRLDQVSEDLSGERRWSRPGPRLHHRLGLMSLLSHRLSLAGEPDTVAALNL